MILNKTKNSKRNIIWGTLGRIATLVLPFILRTVMIKTIGEEYLGLSSLFTSMLSMLSLAELGLGSAMVFYMYQPLAEENLDEICALLKLYRNIYRGIGAFIFLVGLLFVPFLDSFINGSYPTDINICLLYIIYLFDTAISYALFSYRQSLLIVHQRNDIVFKIQLIINVGLYVIQIIVLLLFKNYYMYIIAKPAFTILNNVIILVSTKKIYPQYICKGEISKEKLLEILKKVRALAGHKIGTTVITSADSIVISAFLGLSMVARYGNYYTIISAVISVMGMIINSVLPGIGNELIVDTQEENYRLFKNLNYILMWIVGWCSICFLCLFQPFMLVWVGKDMLLPIESVVLFTIYYYSWQCRVCVNLFKDAAGQWDADFWKPYVSAIANIIINIVLVKTIGFNGVLISTIITMVLINIPWETHVLFKQVFKETEKTFYVTQILFLVKTIFTAGVTYCLCSLISHTGYLGLIEKGIICCIVPNVIFFLLGYKKTEFLFIKKIIFSK